MKTSGNDQAIEFARTYINNTPAGLQLRPALVSIADTIIINQFSTLL